MDKDTARERIKQILERLGLLTAGRGETILALLDDETPSDFRALADKGLSFASGARTRQILNYIAARLGKDGKMDRELRDDIMLPLREVGILLKGYADTKAGRVTLHFWKPKSPNNVYVLNPEFRALLEASDVGFTDALSSWERATPERRHRVTSAEAAAFAQNLSDLHPVDDFPRPILKKDYIAIFGQDQLFLGYPYLLGQLDVLDQVPVLTMDGDEVLGVDQVEHHPQFLAVAVA